MQQEVYMNVTEGDAYALKSISEFSVSRVLMTSTRR